MADKVFGLDFNNNTAPAGASTISVNNGTTLEDVALSDIMKLVQGTNRNILINGEMKISQRATSTAGVTTTSYPACDRWKLAISTLGTWTVSQDTDVPTGQGFSSSMKILCTTAKASPAAGDLIVFQQRVEGLLVQHVAKGTASAKQYSLSFWIKSNLTGTYIAELVDNTNNRTISVSFTVNSANTWEQKQLTFAADTTGAITNDTNAGMNFNIWLACGTTYTSGTLATTWQALTNANRAVGQVNLAATVNNFVSITGIQLEAGSTFTNFEFMPWDAQYQRCLRYYCKSFPYATVPAQNAGLGGAFRFMAGKAGAAAEVSNSFPFQVSMRATPAITLYNPSATNAQVRDTTAAADCSASAAGTLLSDKIVNITATGNAGTAVGNALDIHFQADAEL